MISLRTNYLEVSAQLRQALHEVADAIKPYQVRRAMLPAGKIIRDQVIRAAPFNKKRKPKLADKPHIKTSIFVKAKMKKVMKDRTDIMVAVGYRRAPHAHFPEFGTVGRHWKGEHHAFFKKTQRWERRKWGKLASKYCGRMPAKPYFAPAVMATENIAMALVDQELRKLVDRAWAKKARAASAA